MNETNDGVYSPDQNPMFGSKTNVLISKSAPNRGFFNFSNLVSRFSLVRFSTKTVQTNLTTDTVRLEPAQPDLGISESTRLNATPNVMENAYKETRIGKQNENLGGGPIPFEQINIINQQNKEFKQAEKVQKNKNKSCLVCALVLVLIIILSSGATLVTILISNNNDNEDEDRTNAPTLSPTFAPTFSPFLSTDIDEIREICEKFVEIDNKGETFQFGVCLNDNDLILCEKQDNIGIIDERECLEEGFFDFLDNGKCPCTVGEFIDLRNDINGEEEVCVDNDVNENLVCNLLLDDDPNIQLIDLLD